jgi:hypothetical protein
MARLVCQDILLLSMALVNHGKFTNSSTSFLKIVLLDSLSGKDAGEGESGIIFWKLDG